LTSNELKYGNIFTTSTNPFQCVMTTFNDYVKAIATKKFCLKISPKFANKQ